MKNKQELELVPLQTFSLNLDALLDKIEMEIDKKTKTIINLGTVQYHWLISNEFFEGLSIADFYKIWLAKVQANRGNYDNFMYQNNSDGSFTMGYIDVTPETMFTKNVGKEIVQAKGIMINPDDEK